MSEIQSIAQNNYILHNIDAKKLYVQEPLFTANSGDAVYVGWRPDETVLYSGNLNGTFPINQSLAEPASAFNYIEITNGKGNVFKFDGTSTMLPVQISQIGPGNFKTYFGCYQITNNSTNFNMTVGYFRSFNIIANAVSNETQYSAADADEYRITKIVGINRKENA